MPKKIGIFDPPVDSIDPMLDPYQVAKIQQYLLEHNIGLAFEDTGRNSADKVRTKIYEQMLKDDEYKRMANSVMYSNAGMQNYPEAAQGGVAGLYDSSSANVILSKASALPHENYHANAPRGVDPFRYLDNYFYPPYEYKEYKPFDWLTYSKITDESYEKNQNRRKMYSTLKDASEAWVKKIQAQGVRSSSTEQKKNYDSIGTIEEMLAEIAGNRFLVPQGLFNTEQLNTMEQLMKDRYDNKSFHGILEYTD